MKQQIENLIKEALNNLNLTEVNFTVEHPTRIEFGDYTTNAGIIVRDPEKILRYIVANKPQEIERVEIAGNGFINFYLSKEFFKKSIGEIISKKESFGKGEHAMGFKIMVEHTDPNPFKEFHIGHLMPNVIGSTLARIFEWNGAEVKQANYQGDVGMHVAKAIWGAMHGGWEDAYARGSKMFDEDEEVKKEIQEINKKIYDKSDPEINELYEEGRKASLEYFNGIYKKLGTKFDYYFFESETADIGKKIVEENIGKVFEESDGAIVFKGSHTRVFINSQGLPTYEAKDLGNAKNKFDKYPYDLSVVVTGNEIKDYFKVVLEAMQQVLPDLAKRTKHLPHGMLRLPGGKMSSRTGDVITAEELIGEVKGRTQDNEEVAIGAIKYMILRQAIGNDIVFDFEKSVSTDGDSGPYLQYAYARTNTLMEKAGRKGDPNGERGNVHEVEKLLYRFPEVVERAGKEYSPHYITLYLTELASSFNNFYAHEQVINDDPESSYRLAIVEAFNTVMRNGLTILGIPTVEKM